MQDTGSEFEMDNRIVFHIRDSDLVHQIVNTSYEQLGVRKVRTSAQCTNV